MTWGTRFSPGPPSWAERLPSERCAILMVERVSRGASPPPCSREGARRQQQLGQWGWHGADTLHLLQKPDCCKGFFGPDCAQCPGGFSNPCYGKGNVSPPAPG